MTGYEDKIQCIITNNKFFGNSSKDEKYKKPELCKGLEIDMGGSATNNNRDKAGDSGRGQ